MSLNDNFRVRTEFFSWKLPELQLPQPQVSMLPHQITSFLQCKKRPSYYLRLTSQLVGWIPSAPSERLCFVTYPWIIGLMKQSQPGLELWLLINWLNNHEHLTSPLHAHNFTAKWGIDIFLLHRVVVRNISENSEFCLHFCFSFSLHNLLKSGFSPPLCWTCSCQGQQWWPCS